MKTQKKIVQKHIGCLDLNKLKRSSKKEQYTQGLPEKLRRGLESLSDT